MNRELTGRPGRGDPSRPFSFHLRSATGASGRCLRRHGLARLFVCLLLLALAAPAAGRAQVISPWPELTRLLAPEVGLTGLGETGLLPVAGWGSSGASRTTRPGRTPATDPFSWLAADLPLARFDRSGQLAYRSSTGGRREVDVTGHGWGVSFAVPLDSETWSLLWGGSTTELTTRMRFDEERSTVRSDPGARDVWLGIRRRSRRVTLLAAGGRSGASRSPDLHAVMIGVEPVRDLDVSVWSTRRAGRDGIVIGYRDAGAEVEASVVRSSIGLRLEGELADLRLLLRLERTRITTSRDPDLDHQLRLRPRIGRGELRVTSVAGTWWGALGLEESRYRAWLDSRGLRYSRFLLDDRRRWFRAGHDIRRESATWRLWGGLSDMAWNGEGEVEFWPFTPTIIDLLGLKRRGAAGADFNLFSAGARLITGNRSGRAEIEVGFDMHSLRTDGRIESWEPYLLGIGKTNIIRDRLRLRSAQVADLGVVLALPVLEGVTVRAGAAQLIPLASRLRTMSGGGDGEEPGRGSGQTEWGGLRWWISFDLLEAFFRR